MSHLQVTDVIATIESIHDNDPDLIPKLKQILLYLAYQSSDGESAVNGHVEQWRTEFHDQITGNVRVVGPKKSMNTILNKPTQATNLSPALAKIFGQKKFEN